ncbi:Serpin domain containing protein, partial [Asbolus verrucosus]
GLDKTTLLLVNALYFKGSWKHPFSKHSTEKKNFHKTAKNVIQVDTMRSSGKTFGYYENSQLKAKFLDLRFKGEGVALVIALPNEIEGLAALESHAEKVFGPHKFASETVEVALPKFKIETRTDFKDVLKKLGVNKTFSAEEADLSGIAGEKGDLFVNEVLQKAFIEVDEEGVEAAAATFVASPRMLMLRPPPARKFIADHPFMFYITVKNVIVFGGRVTEPSY